MRKQLTIALILNIFVVWHSHITQYAYWYNVDTQSHNQSTIQKVQKLKLSQYFRDMRALECDNEIVIEDEHFSINDCERFSLLLLEEDEYFVKVLCCWLLQRMAMQTNVDLVDSLSYRCLCYSIVEDMRYPIICIPLRKVTRIGKVGESLSLRCLMTQLVCDLIPIKQYERGPLCDCSEIDSNCSWCFATRRSRFRSE